MRRKGFTLIELLTVIAIIAILAAILVPVVSSVRNSAKRSETKAQFSRYGLAYESFKGEYKYYPTMDAGGGRFELAGNNEVFIETLSGRQKDGQTLSNAYAKRANRKRLTFYTFSQDDFGGPNTLAADGSSLEGQIVDAFGNPNIVIVVDEDGDGVIPASDLEGLPEDAVPANGLNAGVVFYSDPTADEGEYEWIYSWE